MSANQKTTKEKIRAAISRSGYLEEQKVAIEFEEFGFLSGPNYAFMDQDEHKSREMDFVATKISQYTTGTGFYFYVYGEVKKRTNPLIFFERKAHPKEIESRGIFIPIVATYDFFPNAGPMFNIKNILEFQKTHHQSGHEFISAQFCEISRGRAVHRNLFESLFLPLRKCVDSEMTQMRNHTPFFTAERPVFYLNLIQPVLVISGPLYSYDIQDDVITEKDYILYRRHYASKTVTRTLLIDIVKREFLPEYISKKLLATYFAIEETFKKNIDQIIQYCHREFQVYVQYMARRASFQSSTIPPFDQFNPSGIPFWPKVDQVTDEVRTGRRIQLYDELLLGE